MTFTISWISSPFFGTQVATTGSLVSAFASIFPKSCIHVPMLRKQVRMLQRLVLGTVVFQDDFRDWGGEKQRTDQSQSWHNKLTASKLGPNTESSHA